MNKLEKAYSLIKTKEEENVQLRAAKTRMIEAVMIALDQVKNESLSGPCEHADFGFELCQACEVKIFRKFLNDLERVVKNEGVL